MPLESQPRVLAETCRSRRPRPRSARSPRLRRRRGPPRAGVESVLDELLDDGRRALHDLARGDLVDEGIGENLDRHVEDVIGFGARRVQ